MRSPSFLRRVAARLDEMVSQVENHEAMADSAIRSARLGLSRAERAFERTTRDAGAVTTELRAQRELAVAARRRAETEDDDTMALEWLRRARRAGRAAERLQDDARNYREATSALEREVGRIKEQLLSLERTRRLLRAREQRAEVIQAVVGDWPARDDGALAAIRRWEAHVRSAENVGQAALELAELEANAFQDESDLRLELAELRKKRS